MNPPRRWAEASQINETLSTCRFAQRMARLTCMVTPNVAQDSGSQIAMLQA